MMVLHFQLGRAFAISAWASKRTARKTMSASMAGASVMGMIPCPIAAAAGKASRLARRCNGYFDAFAGKCLGQCLADLAGLAGLACLAEADDCVAHVAPSIRQSCASPPPTATSLAVVKLLSDEARKAAAAPISAGSAMRWSGVIAA